MDGRIDKDWAQKYILDPLTAPSPNQETGPGTSHVNQFRAAADARIAAEKQAKLQAEMHSKKQPHSLTTTTKSGRHSFSSYPTPPNSASPTKSQFHPSNAFSSSPKSSVDTTTPRHSRHLSLNERFPGDMSHRPLDMIKQDAQAAERPHRHRRHISDTDMIDSLDTIGGFYHHGGPYDATLLSRNLNEKYSPVAAVRDSTLEVLRATPRSYIVDSLERHMPLQGTATVPSGSYDLGGNKMVYEEGADLMRESDAEGGPYKRWDGIEYHPDDLKGKGEPSYTFERDLKEKKKHTSRHESAEYEMKSSHSHSHRGRKHHQRSASNAVPDNLSSGNASALQRRNSTGNKLSEGLKRRFGSLGKKKAVPTGATH